MEAARRLRGGGASRGSFALDRRQRLLGTPMALRPLGPAADLAGPDPGRPTVDRDARGGTDRVGSLASGAVAALVVGAAARLRADPPVHQRDSSRPLLAGT